MTEITAQTAETAPPTKKNLLSGNRLTSGLATAAVVGIGAALIEVEWIPGLLLGVAAMVAPELVPKVGRGVRPLVHSVIKNGYAASRKTREWMAEAGEQVSDMVAEVRAASMQDDSAPTTAQTAAQTTAQTAAQTAAQTTAGSAHETSEPSAHPAGTPAEG